MQKIRKGDAVKVLTGKDKGKTGVVLKVLSGAKQVLVEGVNLVKKTVKANPQRGIDGGFNSKEAPIDISNVAWFDTKTQKIEKIGFKSVEGKKVRYLKSSGNPID